MTTTQTITKERLREVLEECVQERGADYVYPGESGCNYRWTPSQEAEGHGKVNEPACIVGLALDKLGRLDQAVPNWMSHTNANTSPYQIVDAPEESVIAHTLNKLQVKQDCGTSWGAVVSRFDYLYAETQAEAKAGTL